MKAITLHQPWASLIAEGVKTIETRGREHPWRSAIGETIAIHAAKTWKEWDRLNEPCLMSERDQIQTILAALPGVMAPDGNSWASDSLAFDRSSINLGDFAMPLGAVVATCRLLDVVPMVDFRTEREDTRKRVEWIDNTLWVRVPRVRPAQNISDQLPFGDFAPGRYALILDGIVKQRPVPCRGRQGLWYLPSAVADELIGIAA